MSLRSLLNKTATVIRYTKSSDAYGGYTATSDAVYTGMPIAVQPISGTERAEYRSQKVEVTDIAYYEPDYVLTEDDAISVGGYIFDVEFIADDAGRSHHNKAIIRRIRPAV